MSPRASSATQGILHHIPPVSVFEPTTAATNTTTTTPPPNLLLWIGGLFDTYHNVEYPFTLASRLPTDWSLAQTSLSSAGIGWGTSSLDRDVAEISSIVSYFRRGGRSKVVLMGHSTGCQDSLHYLCSSSHTATTTKPPMAKVDGVILQAPVSDAEALVMEMGAEKLAMVNSLAQHFMSTGRGEDCLPQSEAAGIFGQCPVSARRWLSLSSPDGKGQDDYFSSYLSDERLKATFGKVDVPFLILEGEKDEFVPEHVDRKAMLARWIKVMKDNKCPVDAGSEELLAGATHNLNGDPDTVVDGLCERVIAFLQNGLSS
ncbi:hypothetical protein AAFC00_006256 [Neodothiora populina]|uniref:DUF1749-domain-containing protein n=1 Tax=Neodothiora populina TaxID=2781224 RepID=A0ABR3P4W6_9PEZI